MSLSRSTLLWVKMTGTLTRPHDRLMIVFLLVRLLDFGCGTGETTEAMAKGVLGQLGQPGEVVGVDISADMIGHCRQHCQAPNTSFHQLDVSQAESFTSAHLSSFSLVTSFSCLHWVPDMPATVALFNKVNITCHLSLVLNSG